MMHSSTNGPVLLTDQNCTRLRTAMLAYDRALQAYGLAGSQWVDDSPRLDALYKAMLEAADIDYPGRGSADPDTTGEGRTMTGNQLKAWRATASLSQARLAKALEVDVMTISRWERGERAIPTFLPLALETVERRQAAALTRRRSPL